MDLNKLGLAGSQYHWPAEQERTIFSGDPSRRTFDKYNGEQVLFLINYFGSMMENFTVEEARRLEQMIIRQLPLEPMSEISVVNWIRDNCYSEKTVE